MQISKIERQKKRPDRYSLYIDEQFALGVHEAVLIKCGIHKGMTLTPEKLKTIQIAEYQEGLYQKALNYLSYGLRTAKEIHDYLMKQFEKKNKADSEDQENKAADAKDYPLEDIASEDFIQPIMQQLMDQNLINDRYYAEAYARTQADIYAKGPDKIRYDLLKKGIDPHIVEDAMEEYQPAMIQDNLSKLADKFVASHQKLSQKMLLIKLGQHLITKGYATDQVRDFLQGYSIEPDLDQEWDLLVKEGQKALDKRSRKYSGYELKQRLYSDLVGKGFAYDQVQSWLDQVKEESHD